MESFILEFVKNVLDKNVALSYVMFFVSSILQLVFPPHPADMVLVLEGYVTTVSSSFKFIPVLINALAGTFVGSAIVYKFGFIKGDSVFKYRIIQKFVNEKHKKKTERLFHKYGSYAIILSKFIPGINAVILLFAGIFKMKPRVVYLSILPSIIVHHILVLLLGKFLGHNLQHVKQIITTYNGVIIILLVSISAAYCIYRLIRRKSVDVGNDII